MKYEDFKIHPAADMFPLMPEDSREFAELVEDIKENGLLEDIEILPQTDELLDGRNRLRACLAAGEVPGFVNRYTPTPVQYVITKNLHRRHLTTAQKADVAARLVPMLEAEAKERQGRRTDLAPDFVEDFPQSRSTDQAGKLLGVSGRTVRKQKKLRDERPDLAEEVAQGKSSVDGAYKRAFGSRQESNLTWLCRKLIKLDPQEIADEIFRIDPEAASRLLAALAQEEST